MFQKKIVTTVTRHAPVTLVSLLTFILLSFCAYSQEEEKPIALTRRLDIAISNPLSSPRVNEPVVIPLMEIRKNAPEFNPDFYRVKHAGDGFEPLDIPTQIRHIPSSLAETDDLVFLVDLGPGETKTVELWYTPKGKERMAYPATTQSFASWYHLGSNVAWENEIIAYRSYSGIVDYFAKSYPHLRLHNLPPDSYHHERFWGVDPYMVGLKPGLCGVLLESGGEIVPCYSTVEGSGLTFEHRAIEGGPVCSGAVVRILKDGELMLENIYTLFNRRFENRVTTILPENRRVGGMSVRTAMQTFAGLPASSGAGYVAFQGSPVEEYGTISTALVWPAASEKRTGDMEDGKYVSLQPDLNGAVEYFSVALWNRASAPQPKSDSLFLDYVRNLKEQIDNPVVVDLRKTR